MLFPNHRPVSYIFVDGFLRLPGGFCYPAVNGSADMGCTKLPNNRGVALEPLYLRHDDALLRSVNFLALGVIVKTGKLFNRSKTKAVN